MSYALAIHTTSPELGLALSNFAGDGRCQTWNLGRSLSTHLHVHLNEFIQPQTWADLAFIAVAKGPGSFTSTRIGMVTARTLSQQLGIPLFGISTLAAVAWSQYAPPCSDGEIPKQIDIAVQMPAQRGEVFSAIYAIDYSPVETETGRSLLPQLITRQEDQVLSVEAWQHQLQSWTVPHHLMTTAELLGSSARSLLDLAHLDWQRGARPDWMAVLPFYGQSCVV